MRLNQLNIKVLTRKRLLKLHREIEDNKSSKTTCVNKSLSISNDTPIGEDFENAIDLSITIKGRFHIRTIGCNAEALLLNNGKIVIQTGAY